MKKYLLLIILLITQNFHAQSDCASAIPVCGNSNISYTPSGYGNVFEDLGGCMSTDERYTVWYTFTAETAGTLAFTIDPNVFEDDYDFAVYGPNKTCNSRGTPIRCNYSGLDGPTGLSLTIPAANYPTGNSNTWSPQLQVNPGETYILVIDNYSRSTNGFSLNWSGTATLQNPFNNPGLNPFGEPGAPAANPTQPNEVPVCSLDALFDFSTLSAGIVNGNANYHVSYHTTMVEAYMGTNAINSPQLISLLPIYYYSIYYHDPANPGSDNNCRQVGKFKFKYEEFVANNAELLTCNNYFQGEGTFDLTAAEPTVFAGVGTFTYYNSMQDAQNQNNAIANPNAFVSSAPSTVFVRVENPDGCSDISEISLKFHPTADVVDATLRKCSIPDNEHLAEFDLTDAAVSPVGGTTKNYYPSLADAQNGTNEIANPTSYIAPNGFVYVKVTNNEGCYNIAKITLFVYPPNKSTVLKDVQICMDDTVTLDAGAGFDEYEWSTGERTQTITVPVGTYWVNLTSGECVYKQHVTVYPTAQPVISSLEMSNNNLSVGVIGGNPPYAYSIDNINWQTTNTFENLPRGEYTVYVKDIFDCKPIVLPVTNPNLINVITPNGDGINDVLDYSALANKRNLVFSLFDRYGHQVHKADHTNGYKWDGTTNGGKKVPTGTYWYTISWSEEKGPQGPIVYSGWIMVKNRE